MCTSNVILTSSPLSVCFTWQSQSPHLFVTQLHSLASLDTSTSFSISRLRLKGPVRLRIPPMYQTRRASLFRSSSSILPPTPPPYATSSTNSLVTRHLRSRLPGCKWFEEGAIEFDSDCPADAGEVANMFAGTMGDRKVLVKCYRFYPSTDYLPSYMVRMLSDLWVCRVYPKLIGRGSTQKHWPAVVTRTRASCHLSAYTLPPGIRCALSSSTCTTQT